MNSARRLEDILAPDENSFGAVRLGAALVVAVTHGIEIVRGNLAWDWAYAASGYTSGQHAVHVFFILSGILVTASLARTRDVFRFMAARVLRIFPGLIACVLVTAMLLGPFVTTSTLSDYFGDPALLRYAVETVLLITGRSELPGVFLSNPLAGEVNNSVWTLKYEMLCYVSLAGVFLLGFLGSHTKALTGAALLIVLLVGSYLTPGMIEHKTALDVLRRFILCFALGSAAYVAGSYLRIRHITLAAIAVLTAVLWPTNLKTPAILFFEAYAVLWIAGFKHPAFNMFTANHDLSYGVYLYGWPISQTLVQLFPDAGAGWIVGMTLAVLLPVAAISWHTIEHPAQKWGRKRLESNSAVSGLVA